MKKEVRLSYTSKRRAVIGLSIVLILLIYFLKDASYLLRAGLMIGWVVFFYLADHVFDLRFKHRHYLFIITIGALSFLLSPFYYIYPNYDKFQHFFEPILISSIVFFLVSKLRLKMKWALVFTFFITVAFLGLFEIGEYSLDVLFDMKMQGVYLRDLKGLDKFNLVMDPIDDTMIDLVLGVLGTTLYCTYKAVQYKINNKKRLKN